MRDPVLAFALPSDQEALPMSERLYRRVALVPGPLGDPVPRFHGIGGARDPVPTDGSWVIELVPSLDSAECQRRLEEAGHRVRLAT